MANSSKIFILTLFVTWLVCSLILIPAAETHAWEVMAGRISSMQTVGDKIQLTVLLDASTTKTDTATVDPKLETSKNTRETDTENPAVNSFNLEIESRNLPPQLKEGDYIRIWRKPDNPQKPWRISSSHGHDPTGVRSRLKGRGRLSGRGSGRGGGKGGHSGH